MWAMLGVRSEGPGKTCSGKLDLEPNSTGSGTKGSISGRDFPFDSGASP